MNVILYDDQSWQNLLPLTFTRPVSEIRVGIYTLREKWNLRLGTTCSVLTQDYLQESFPLKKEDVNLMINSSFLPDKELVDAIRKLNRHQVLTGNGIPVAAQVPLEKLQEFMSGKMTFPEEVKYRGSILKISYPWDIFRINKEAIEWDFRLVGAGRNSASLNDSNRVVGKYIFVEEGAQVDFATLNSSTGPIYIGKDAQIMEGSFIRGPFALLDHSVVKMGAKIYGPTTIGPNSKVGGELNNVVFQGNSNKAHDGFLGNSVIGEWVNIGADTNCSNLKNNYAEVKVWNYPKEAFIPTGLQFCGLIMGDHSKCGINTMFNTGTVVGVSCNIFGAGFPRNFIPSFSWGGPQGFTEFPLNKAFDVATRVLARRGANLSESEKRILSEVFKRTAKYRNY